jgi:hypothetical protein
VQIKDTVRLFDVTQLDLADLSGAQACQHGEDIAPIELVLYETVTR